MQLARSFDRFKKVAILLLGTLIQIEINYYNVITHKQADGLSPFTYNCRTLSDQIFPIRLVAAARVKH